MANTDSGLTIIMRDGAPVRDEHGRVRVDCGQWEDWVLPEDLPEELQALVATMPIPACTEAPQCDAVEVVGDTPTLQENSAQGATVVSPPAVTQAELAAALAAELAGNGRRGASSAGATPAGGAGRGAVSPEEQAANLRRTEALAQKAEADAALSQAKAREAQAKAAAAEGALLADTPAVQRLRQSAAVTRLSRQAIADSVAAAKDTARVAAITRERQAQEAEITRYQDAQAEAGRRKQYGVSGWQLFGWSLLGWVVGGLVVGLLARGCGAEDGGLFLAQTVGHVAGVVVALVWRLRRGQRLAREAQAQGGGD